MFSGVLLAKTQGAAGREDVAEGQGAQRGVAPRRAAVDGQALGIGQAWKSWVSFRKNQG